MKVQVIDNESLEEMMYDGNMGICLNCGEIAYSVEPDARNYKCEACNRLEVFGLEEAMLMGMIKIEEGDEE